MQYAEVSTEPRGAWRWFWRHLSCGIERALVTSMNGILVSMSAMLALTSCNRSYSTHASSEPRAAATGTVSPSGPRFSYADVVERVARRRDDSIVAPGSRFRGLSVPQ